MEKISVHCSRDYDVLIGNGILKDAGEYIARIFHKDTAFIVSDDNVFRLYGETLRNSLTSAGFKTAEFVFSHGEINKNLPTYASLMETMCQMHISRSSFIVALGGGVVGDLAGFAAATYQRGIPFVQIPTSLLAAVDASVGGKTAVDLQSGKNQVGCFHQPSLVLCDTGTLATLPEDEYCCGCAEIIKYAMIGSDALFSEIMNVPVSGQYDHVIAACVKMKRDYVEQDEFDRGCRMLLNFGHTFGHAAEACSGFSLLHGQAVAMGMAAITKAACAFGICPEATLNDLLALLSKYELPQSIPFPAVEMLQKILADKKFSGDHIRLIVPERIGKCRIEAVLGDELINWLKSGGLR